MKAFYFATEERKLRYGDNRNIVVGESHTITGTPKLCRYGLHGSVRIIDALKHAPGPILYLVDIEGELDVGKDKICGKKRTYLKVFDATKLLREFARKQALVNIHKIKQFCCTSAYSLVVEYLNTGDESIRSAAELAARSAAKSVAWSAAKSVAWSAAESAAWSAARSAAELAAWSAARSATWSAANEMLLQMVREKTGWEV